MHNGQRLGASGSSVAFEMEFGWVLTGNTSSCAPTHHATVHHVSEMTSYNSSGRWRRNPHPSLPGLLTLQGPLMSSASSPTIVKVKSGCKKRRFKGDAPVPSPILQSWSVEGGSTSTLPSWHLKMVLPERHQDSGYPIAQVFRCLKLAYAGVI